MIDLELKEPKCKWQNWVVMCMTWASENQRIERLGFMTVALRVDPSVLQSSPGLLSGQVRDFGVWWMTNREAPVQIDPPCWVKYDC